MVIERLVNDIGYTPFSPGCSEDSISDWRKLEQLRRLKLVVTLCDGNAFRSRVGKLALNRLGVSAISAAVGDITKQHNKILPPNSVMSFMDKAGYPRGELSRFRFEPMRMASKLMVTSAAHILAYCPPEHLAHLIDLSDPRLHLLEVRDPVSPDDYISTYEQVFRKTIDFFHQNFPDRSAAMTNPTPTSGIISRRIEAEMSKLDFSIVPSEWGNPFTSYDVFAHELL